MLNYTYSTHFIEVYIVYFSIFQSKHVYGNMPLYNAVFVIMVANTITDSFISAFPAMLLQSSIVNLSQCKDND